ncbi:transmembrane protein 53-A-like isoform X1 [Ranitomeya variabilis]|uniref:transmembrane protein 53-A-like isoform X1 n=1 Tax=Ranitomeya variabilis TaxID=490064 RepID=UPI004055C1AA
MRRMKIMCSLRGTVRRTACYLLPGRLLHYQASASPVDLTMKASSGSVLQEQALTTSLPPCVKKYSNSVSLYINPTKSENCQSPRPLLLFLPWLGSNSRSHEKYIQLYFKLGFDVLVVESSMLHFLWPKTGLEFAGRLLHLLVKEKDLSSRKLYIHAMSIGGYTFAQMLVGSSMEQRKILEKIHGQVFDSLVIGSIERMARGVARMVSFPLLESLMVRVTLLYFSLLKAHTADYYEKGIQAFWESPVTCPALFFYCMNDPMSDHTTVDKLLEYWEKKGIEVQGKNWEKSVHAGHLRRHTREYTEILNNFISGLQARVPKSKL